MKEQIASKLWVIKLCLKIVYPKFNYYLFLVYLAIKYRIFYHRLLEKHKTMNQYTLKTIPSFLMTRLIKENSDENFSVLSNKCLLVPKDSFIRLCCENFFYMDNGVLWVAIKLSPNMKRVNDKKQEKKELNLLKSLNLMTSEIHKKLWTDDLSTNEDSIRIVPVVGSKIVKDACTTSDEFYNIASLYKLSSYESVEVTLHPIPSFECSPKIAAIAEVSLIVNDYDLENDFIKEVLSNHFELPKLMSVNDMFSIHLTPSVTAKYHYKYLDLVHSAGKLFFKCNKLRNDEDSSALKGVVHSFFIVRGVTQLTLGENIHLLKPREEYVNLQVDKNISIHLCPTGLRNKFDQIQETILPFLTGEINDLSLSLSSPLIPMLLLTGFVGSGRHLLVKTLAKFNGMNCLQLDCNALQSSTAKQTESKINAMIQKAKTAAPVLVLLDNFEVFAVDPENNEDCRIMEYFMNTLTDLYWNYTKHPIIFIAITERQDLQPNMVRMFLEHFHIPRLSSKQRFEMLQWFTAVMKLNIDGQQAEAVCDSIGNSEEALLDDNAKEVLQRLSAKTETFVMGDLDTLMHFAIRESYLKQQSNQLHSDPNLQYVKEEDFSSALESIRRLQSQHLDAPKIPKVYWEDIGGLEQLKRELLKTIEFPIKYPHLFKNSSLKRSGILLYGPPGCGKTLVAKAVSTELNVSFLSVKGPELLNMYIGQSEENVRKVFEAARASSPCIVFLDELDALAPRRGAAGDSGGASDRVVSQLLAEVDGVAAGEDADKSSFVFIMGATNRPDLLEQSLLRPGRLDKLIYVGPYNGIEEKTCVLKALCRSYKLRPEVNLCDVSAALPERCTGADLLHVVTTARSSAVRGLVDKLNAGIIKESELSTDSVILGISELWQGVETFRPSVTDEELAYYESLQSQM